MEIIEIERPHPECVWAVWPYVIMGLTKDPPEILNLRILPIATSDAEITDALGGLEDSCYYGCDSLHRVLVVCLIIALYKLEVEDAILSYRECMSEYYMLQTEDSIMFPTKLEMAQLKRYRRPLRVIFCGDRNSGSEFETVISFELDRLPKYSTIIHGGCKGVDRLAGLLASQRQGQGFCVIEYPARWDTFSLSAGPIRNQEMLDKECPDLVLAFHPDIDTSKGTKDMMRRAWTSQIPVYIHDLKRKSKFEGDFKVL